MTDLRWSDDRDDREFDDDGEYDDDSFDTVPCPACGADVFEDAVKCPSCGDYITHATSVWAGRSWLWIALGLLGSLALIAMLVLGGF